MLRLLFPTLILAPLLAAQAVAPLALKEPVRDKIFGGLQLLATEPAIGKLAVAKDPARPWTPEQSQMVEARLRELYRSNGGVKKLVAGPLRQSGVLQRHAALPDEDLLATAWREAAEAMNRLISVYGDGAAPRYPAIDGPLYADLKAPAYQRLQQLAAQVAAEEAAQGEAFFAPSLRYALLLLEINLRNEAGRYEPLERGENRAALERAARLDWRRYRYTAIVVPGAGSDRPGVALSPFGRLRLRLAVQRYRAGHAPFVLVSGGHVHPDRTPFNEAMEMKKALVETFGIPAEAILVDPHARHTTTNLRNAARQIFRYGMPFDRPALITTDPGQSRYIEDPGFAVRCRTELRYLPFRSLKRTSEFDLEFLPALEVLTQDGTDPLDP
jgi:hypothetical protein